MHQREKAYIKIAKIEEKFEMYKGVRQGNSLTLNIFKCVLEEIKNNLNWEQKDIKIDGGISE